MSTRIHRSIALALGLSLVACNETGATGPTGAAGPTGAVGATGAPGSTGATGPMGAPGTSGSNGTNGVNGTNGSNGANGTDGKPGRNLGDDLAASFPTATPVKHVVVIFQENVSFDHYYGTYPVAANLPGETPFTAATGTPAANTLTTPLDPTKGFSAMTGVDLVNNNPNGPTGSGAAQNGANAWNPFRLTPAQAATADQDHEYTDEEKSFNNGLMDAFPLFVGVPDSVPPQDLTPPLNSKALVMGWYDGNTVTAMWNYAQHFVLNDNSYGTTFGPSAPGALNLISGQTSGVAATNVKATDAGSNIDFELSNDGHGGASITGDPQPLGDICSSRDQAQLGGLNVGDYMNDAGVSWGFFQGGFDLTLTNSNGSTGCSRSNTSPWTLSKKGDYIPHHQPFQYYASTANPTHARPSSLFAIGNSTKVDGTTPEPANHQYDLHDFFDALEVGNFPAVTFLKASGYQDGHAGYSSPLDEQTFVVEVMNRLQETPEWSSTVVIIAWDDSDGWYDHQMPPIVNPSTNSALGANMTLTGQTVIGLPDGLNGDGLCNHSSAQQGAATPSTPLSGPTTAAAMGRCGYGPRLPLLVISPFAKKNYVDHTLTDQSSILRFVEDNWLKGVRIKGSFDALAGSFTGAGGALDFTLSTPKVFLDPSTGALVNCPTCL